MYPGVKDGSPQRRVFAHIGGRTSVYSNDVGPEAIHDFVARRSEVVQESCGISARPKSGSMQPARRGSPSGVRRPMRPQRFRAASRIGTACKDISGVILVIVNSRPTTSAWRPRLAQRTAVARIRNICSSHSGAALGRPADPPAIAKFPKAIETARSAVNATSALAPSWIETCRASLRRECAPAAGNARSRP